MKRRPFKFYKEGIPMFVCLFFGLLSCNQQPKPTDRNSPETTKTVETPKGIISKTQAQELFDNYSKFRVPAIDSLEQQRMPKENFKATRFLSIEYQRLKDYIAYVENEAQLANVPITNFRIYLATYPEKAKFPRRNTLFILPTTTKNGAEFGFFTLPGEGDSRTAVPINASLTKDLGLASGLMDRNEAGIIPSLNSNVLQGGNSLILNDMGNSPPPKTDF